MHTLNKDAIKNFLIDNKFSPIDDKGKSVRYTDETNQIHLIEDGSLKVPYSAAIDVYRYNIYLTKNEKLIYTVDVKNEDDAKKAVQVLEHALEKHAK